MANGGASAVGSPNSSCLNALYLRLSETDLTQVLSTHIGQLGADWFDLEGLNISRFPTGYRYGHVVAGRLRTPGGYSHGADEIHTWCSLSGRYCRGTEREMEYIRHSPVIDPGRSIVEWLASCFAGAFPLTRGLKNVDSQHSGVESDVMKAKNERTRHPLAQRDRREGSCQKLGHTRQMQLFLSWRLSCPACIENPDKLRHSLVHLHVGCAEPNPRLGDKADATPGR